jgi:serine/threonine protein kinase
MYYGGNKFKSEKSTAGSLKYMAPEILKGVKTSADPAIDVWSIGCILYYLTVGIHPFEASNRLKMQRKIIELDTEFPENAFLGDECKHLISRMLDRNHDKRITIPDILSHPWVKKGQEDNKTFSVHTSFGGEDEDIQMGKFDIES